jgi:alpha-galactosidase
MQGALGIGANLNRWSEADTALAKKMIALDKEIRQTVQTGALYRLLSPRTSDVIANQYVSGDGRQSVLFAFRHAQQFDLPAEAIHLEGLAPQAVYGLQYLNGRTAELSGAYLMRHGVDVNLRGDYDSTSVVITRR